MASLIKLQVTVKNTIKERKTTLPVNALNTFSIMSHLKQQNAHFSPLKRLLSAPLVTDFHNVFAPEYFMSDEIMCLRFF